MRTGGQAGREQRQTGKDRYTHQRETDRQREAERQRQREPKRESDNTNKGTHGDGQDTLVSPSGKRLGIQNFTHTETYTRLCHVQLCIELH